MRIESSKSSQIRHVAALQKKARYRKEEKAFVVEGIIIGLFGAGIPLVLVYYAYSYAVRFCLSHLSILSRILTLLPVWQVFQVLVPVSLGLGLGIGLFGSWFSIRKHLRA